MMPRPGYPPRQHGLFCQSSHMRHHGVVMRLAFWSRLVLLPPVVCVCVFVCVCVCVSRRLHVAQCPLPRGTSQHESSVASSQIDLPPPGCNHENGGVGRVIETMTLLLRPNIGCAQRQFGAITAIQCGVAVAVAVGPGLSSDVAHIATALPAERRLASYNDFVLYGLMRCLETCAP